MRRAVWVDDRPTMRARAAALLALAAAILSPCCGALNQYEHEEAAFATKIQRPSMKPTAKPSTAAPPKKEPKPAAPRAGFNLESLLTPGAQVPPEILTKALEANKRGEGLVIGGSSQISSSVAWLREGVCADKQCVEGVEKRWNALLVTGGLGMMGSTTINEARTCCACCFFHRAFCSPVRARITIADENLVHHARPWAGSQAATAARVSARSTRTVQGHRAECAR